MTDSELERAVSDLADGKRLDWEQLEAGGKLSLRELDALRLLERARLNPPEALEDGFEIRAELGRGSMGRVCRAFDRSLQREVALKILAPKHGWKVQSRTRFVQEARLLASVRHPGIVQVHSIHEHGGEVRIALELIEGRTLQELVDAEGPLSCAEAARVGSELCRALSALHARGITHRDLKPANVMREKGGRIVLLDFGIARSPSSFLPTAADSAGTPRFMAPEQFEGGTIGPYTDLWALGALLYWLVSARFPFEGEEYATLRRHVLSERATPLLDRRADVDPRFAATLARALAREPGERHATAGELEAELRLVVGAEDEPPAPVPAPPAPSTPAPPGAGRSWGSFLALGLIVTALALAGLLWRSRPPEALFLEAHFYAQRGAEAIRLQDGDSVTQGDLILLEASSPEPFYLYVFNQDDAGEMHVLFPVPGFEPANPLPAGATQRLPGRYRGESQLWQVTSDGAGGESLLLVAAREPLQAMETLLASIPPVVPGAPPTYPALSPQDRRAVLRGIGGTTSEPQPTAAPAAQRASADLDLATILQEVQLAPGFAVRTLRLRNR